MAATRAMVRFVKQTGRFNVDDDNEGGIWLRQHAQQSERQHRHSSQLSQIQERRPVTRQATNKTSIISIV